MTLISDTIRNLADNHLVLRLKAMRRLSDGDRPHWTYNFNKHMALLDKCKRRGLEIK